MDGVQLSQAHRVTRRMTVSFLPQVPRTYVFHACMGWIVSYDLQVFLSLARSFQTFLSFRSLLITLFHVFQGCPLGKLSLTLKVLHFLDHVFSSILST